MLSAPPSAVLTTSFQRTAEMLYRPFSTRAT
jgi:hypothetical protein